MSDAPFPLKYSQKVTHFRAKLIIWYTRVHSADGTSIEPNHWQCWQVHNELFGCRQSQGLSAVAELLVNSGVFWCRYIYCECFFLFFVFFFLICIAVQFEYRTLFNSKNQLLCSNNVVSLFKLIQASSQRYLRDLITVQPSRSTRSSALVIFSNHQLTPVSRSQTGLSGTHFTCGKAFSYSSCFLSVLCIIITRLFSIIMLWSLPACWRFSWRFPFSS